MTAPLLSSAPRRKRFDWAVWTTRKDLPAGIVSFYVDLNVEGVFVGGGFWRFEGYVYLTRRGAA